MSEATFNITAELSLENTEKLIASLSEAVLHVKNAVNSGHPDAYSYVRVKTLTEHATLRIRVGD